MNIIRLDEVDSTNSYVERNARHMAHGDTVTARTQTAGRGQRGNTWESEPGANLTFTMLLCPDIEASRQFAISEAFSLCVCDALKEICGVECRVKWPNDIYAGDGKICGILISHALQGKRILHTVAGAGININQLRFLSDAPNPVSVRQITGLVHDPDAILALLAGRIEKETDRLASEEYRAELHRRYMRSLWRGDGQMYPFMDTETGERFAARVTDVEPSGHLVLTDAAGNHRRFAFKEVAWL